MLCTIQYKKILKLNIFVGVLSIFSVKTTSQDKTGHLFEIENAYIFIYMYIIFSSLQDAYFFQDNKYAI